MTLVVIVYPHALVDILRYGTIGIAVVTIGIAVFNITTSSIDAVDTRRAIGRIAAVVLGLRIRQSSISIDGIILVGSTRRGHLIVISLVEVEAVEVVAHRTVVEGCLAHRNGESVIVIRLLVVQRFGIVAVYALVSACCGITKDGMNTAIRRTSRIDPAVLYITATRISNTCRGERTCHTEVIYITAEVAKQ